MIKKCLLYMFILFFACCKKESSLPAPTIETNTVQDKDSIILIPEQLPEFKGGQGEFFKFLESNMKFPILTTNTTSQFKCIIRMIVSREGKIEMPEIISSSGFPDFDEDALRVMKLSPDWLPGRSRGNPVRCYFTISVKYKK
jgi:periplasmic protein TonB